MTQSGGGGNSPEDRVGGFPSHKDLLDSVVKWIPLLSKLFFFRHQGKYRAWNTSSTVATGAIQIPSNSSSSEVEILTNWSNQLTQEQRRSILLYTLSFRLGGQGCSRKFSRPFFECEDVVTHNGKFFCRKNSDIPIREICDQASQPDICKKRIAIWKSNSNCGSFSDASADRFFSWLSSKVVNQSENMAITKLKDFYLTGVPKNRKK